VLPHPAAALRRRDRVDGITRPQSWQKERRAVV